MKTRAEYEAQRLNAGNDRPFTIPDGLTVSRPVLAGVAAGMLLTGRRGVTPVVAVMAATDMEGRLGRWIDRKFPESRLGNSAHGAAYDTYADTAALMIVGSATLAAPKVTKTAKVAVGAIMAQEGWKLQWAVRNNGRLMTVAKDHRNAVNEILSDDRIMSELEEVGEEAAENMRNERQERLAVLPGKLELPASEIGKSAMADKLEAVVCAVATNDFENPITRTALSLAAIGLAGVGSWNGEYARREYVPMAKEAIAEQQAAFAAFSEQFQFAA